MGRLFCFSVAVFAYCSPPIASRLFQITIK